MNRDSEILNIVLEAVNKNNAITVSFSNRERIIIKTMMKQYAEECVKASLEKADKSFKNTAAKSINTAIKYFDERNHETIYKRDVISFLNAFHQFESQGLSIVGMGYKRFDGKEITDLEGAYEGGFYTEKKKYEISNNDNIVLL
nr:MAG TPA: hypothetical protein [Caudoviricetes sp.]